jgi:hypothetical protein
MRMPSPVIIYHFGAWVTLHEKVHRSLFFVVRLMLTNISVINVMYRHLEVHAGENLGEPVNISVKPGRATNIEIPEQRDLIYGNQYASHNLESLLTHFEPAARTVWMCFLFGNPRFGSRFVGRRS